MCVFCFYYCYGDNHSQNCRWQPEHRNFRACSPVTPFSRPLSVFALGSTEYRSSIHPLVSLLLSAHICVLPASIFSLPSRVLHLLFSAPPLFRSHAILSIAPSLFTSRHEYLPEIYHTTPGHTIHPHFIPKPCRAANIYTPCRPDATRTPRAGGRSRDAPGLPVVTASARLASVLKEETVDDMVLQADRYENENGFKN